MTIAPARRAHPRTHEPIPIDPQVIFNGTWKRPNGTPILIAKNVGTQTISDECNLVTVARTMEVMLLDGKTSLEKADVPVMHGHRVVLEPYVPVGP